MGTPRLDAPFFTLCGVIEGFYGPYYSAAQRQDLIRFLGEQGFNLYIYAPKNDRCHRDDWRRPYSTAEMARFAETIAVADKAGLTFCYALSPSAGLHYADPGEFATITAKLEAFYRLGARAFALLLDDVTPRFACAEDEERYPSPAAAQADLCNRVFAWLQELDPACPLFVCPTEYAGRAPFPDALHTLGALLHPAIALFYTGPEICSPAIAVADVESFAAATGRPPVIWDNYPVNDLAMAPDLHLGPLVGRAAELYAHTRGYVANLMLQPAASQIALQTVGEYLRAPHAYDPAAAWERALRAVAGPTAYPALRRFAENSLSSAPYPGAPEPLATLAMAALASLKLGEHAGASSAVAELENYLALLRQGGRDLLLHLENRSLLEELSPWLKLLELWAELGLQALALARVSETASPAAADVQRLGELRAAILAHPCRMAGSVLLPLADHAQERARFPVPATAAQEAPSLPPLPELSPLPPTMS